MKKTFFVPNKIAKVLFTVAFVLVCGVLFAQSGDSTIANPTGSADGLIQSLSTWIEAKWPIVGTIGSILFLISEGLALIPSIKSNSVFQLIFGWLGKLFSKKGA